MKLDYLVPSPALAGLVSIVGHVHALAAPLAETVPALLPNLHLRLAGRSRYRFADGIVHDAPRAALIGVTSAAFVMETSADFEMICIGFLPEGWRAIVRAPALCFADTLVDADTVWPAGAVDTLWHAVGTAGSLAVRGERLEAFLLGQFREPGGGALDRLLAVRRWIEAPGPLALDALIDRLTLSPRQVARITLDDYGIGPKTLAMKYRALRAAGALAIGGEAGFDEAAADYADQSHLIRDFRRFVGWTPSRFLRERQPLARATLRGRWVAGARSPMALLS